MPLTTLRVWLVGQVTAREFSPAIEWLQSRASCTVEENATAAHGHEPDAIVLCATRPGQISQAQVEDFRRKCPLSGLLALVGPWCEGEPRSGRPWPGVTRIYWHQWQPRLQEEIGQLFSADKRLPATASDADRLLSRGVGEKRPGTPMRVGVVASRQTDVQSLVLALSATGYLPVRLTRGEPLPVPRLDAVIVDAGRDLADAANMLAPIRLGLPMVPALLLANFLRPEEVASAHGLEKTAFLAKPLLLADLLGRLAALLPRATEPARLHAVGQVA